MRKMKLTDLIRCNSCGHAFKKSEMCPNHPKIERQTAKKLKLANKLQKETNLERHEANMIVELYLEKWSPQYIKGIVNIRTGEARKYIQILKDYEDKH